MKLSQLRYLVAAAEAGSVRQAARNLNISQSAITKGIQQLEHRLNAKLLHRRSHGVMLTPAGEALVIRARNVDAELMHARNDIEMVQKGVHGDIRICASPSVMLGLLPTAVIEFKRKYPNVRFQIEEGLYPDVVTLMRKREIDFAICLVPTKSPENGIQFHSLVRDKLTPAVRSGHSLLQKKNLKLEDLLDEEWVSYRSVNSDRDIFDVTFSSNGLEPPKNVIKCTSFTCNLALVEQSDCITLVPKKMFSAQKNSGKIVAMTLSDNMPTWNVMLISRYKQHLSPLCNRFLKEMLSTAS